MYFLLYIKKEIKNNKKKTKNHKEKIIKRKQKNKKKNYDISYIRNAFNSYLSIALEPLLISLNLFAV